VAGVVGMPEQYDVLLVVAGLAILATALLPRTLEHRPLALPVLLLGLGFVAFALPLGLEAPDPLAEPIATERITELAVILALMGAGLRIERAPDLRAWASTWRLLAITMPFTIGLAAVLGWWAAGLAPATAMLLGAAIAPTDPVLAADVEVRTPEERGPDEEDEGATEAGAVRFALTSEAGLNDGLAFPFTNMAVAMAVAGVAPRNWLLEWLAVDVAYKVSAALVLGLVLGRLTARIVFSFYAESVLAKLMTGLAAVASTLLVYGLTEVAGAYGFLAVFIAGVSIRNADPGNEYQQALRDVTEGTVRVTIAAIVVLLGGAIAGGLLAPLGWSHAAVGGVLVLVVRPLSGALGLVGFASATGAQKATIAFFGIRGVGSLYYMAHGLNEAEFEGAEELWALVAFVVTFSILLHGITGSPVMDVLRRHRR
jgi:sodium/hydrogen antiporter